MRHFLVLVLTVMCGCSGARDPDSLLGPDRARWIVVDARLIVSRAFPPIFLTTTESAIQTYRRGQALLHGAAVILTVGDRDTVWYHDTEGAYQLAGVTPALSLNVQPHTTYVLHVRAPDGRTVTAQTTTPGTFRVREWLLVDPTTFEIRRRLAAPQYPWVAVPGISYPDSVYTTSSNQLVYQDGLVEARFDRGSALAFQMALWNLEGSSPLLLDADFVSQSDLARLDRESSSPPLVAPDDYLRLPWAAVWFQGRHQFAIYSVDQNWYDIARSVRFYAPAGLGFGTNAGDDLEKPIFHVQGGIGLFGSAAMDWTGFTVNPKP